MKRFKTETQGTLQHYWNVIDTKTNTYVKRLTTRYEAEKLVKQLNKTSIRRLRNDLADFLYELLHD